MISLRGLGRLLTVFLLLTMISCGGGGGGSSSSTGGNVPAPPPGGGDTNDPNAPIAVAGADKLALSGNIVTLNGSLSSDPQGSALQYAWSQTLGDSVTLTGANTAIATFVAPSATAGGKSLTFKLVVTDGESKTGYAVVTVHVDPPPSVEPKAIIDPVFTPKPGDTVVLGGSHSVDPLDADLTYSWSQIAGPAVALDGTDSDTAFFIAPDTTENLVFRLTVTTAGNLTSSAQTGVTVTNTPPLPPQSSAALIDTALQTGAITAQKAMVYKALALFNDSRLPEEYSGTVPGQATGTTAITELVENFASLSAQDKALVAPFLLPPYVTGSWEDLRNRGLIRTRGQPISPAPLAPPAPIVWKFEGNDKVKVWYKDGQSVNYADGKSATMKSLAEGVLGAVKGKIWSKLNTLMQREPLPDGGMAPLDADYAITPGNYDTAPTLDIILSAGLDCYGVCVPYKNRPTPAFLVIDAQRTPLGDEVTQGLIQTVAHELMHAWQCSFATKEDAAKYSWMREATAVWVEDYVYPDANTENEYANTFMDSMAKRLDNKDNDRHYGAYLPFAYWTSNQIKGGPPDIVRQMFANVPTQTSLDAVDLVNPVPYGEYMPHFLTSFFERYWGDFLVAAWNHGADGYFRKKDNALATPMPRATKSANMSGGTDRKFFLGDLDPDGKIELPYLSGRYYYFLFNDDSTRSVMFFDGLRSKLTSQVIDNSGGGETNGYMFDPLEYSGMEDPAEGATWKVLVKVGGKWKHYTEDPVNAASPILHFCRDYGPERIQEMAIAIGNSSATTDNLVTPPAGGLSPLLFTSNMGCWRWEGDITVKYTNPQGGPNESSTTHLVLANPADLGVGPVPKRPYGLFAVLSATTTTTVSGSSSWSSTSESGLTSSETCTYSGSGTFAWDESRYGYEMKMIPFAKDGTLYRKAWFENGSGSVGTVDYKANCTSYWEVEITDENGNTHIESRSSSSSSTNTFTPIVWPPGLGGDNKLEISSGGNSIKGSFTSEDMTTEYDWSLNSLRANP